LANENTKTTLCSQLDAFRIKGIWGQEHEGRGKNGFNQNQPLSQLAVVFIGDLNLGPSLKRISKRWVGKQNYY